MASDANIQGMTNGAAPVHSQISPPLATPPMTPAPVAARSSAYRPVHRGRKPASVTAPDTIGHERDGWSRKMAATLAYLKNAYRMIDQAESRISAQQTRIALLEDLATTDDLTGLKNRRGLFDVFEREIERCNRGASKGGLLVMIDLDNFKSTNDVHGHQAGDGVLKLVAKTLLADIRKTDIAARIGGDEFVLLLTNTTHADAATRAQSIAWHLNNLSLAWYGDVIPVQASVGLKPFGSGARADAILNAADSKMYSSKSARKTANHLPS